MAQQRQESRERQRRNRGVAEGRHEQQALRVATAPMEAWEREKVGRVKNAFDRIVDHGWVDKSELILEAHELNHINAVREHFGMRRDKLQTPSVHAGHGSNRMDLLEWTENVHALEKLGNSTGVQEGFCAMVERTRRNRERQERRVQEVELAKESRRREVARASFALPGHEDLIDDLMWVP